MCKNQRGFGIIGFSDPGRDFSIRVPAFLSVDFLGFMMRYRAGREPLSETHSVCSE